MTNNLTVSYLDTLGCILYAKKEDKDSLSAFEAAVQKKKADTNISWNVLASVYKRLGKDAESIQALEKYNLLQKK